MKDAFDLRWHPRQPADAARRVTLKEMRQGNELYYSQVEEFTYMLLTNPKRKGGATPQEQAKEMAFRESKRHRVMSLLREFVMSNYEFDRSVGGINIYRYKENLKEEIK